MWKECLQLSVLLIHILHCTSSFIHTDFDRNNAVSNLNELSSQSSEFLENSDCSIVASFNSTKLNATQCFFVRNADDCQIDDGFVNYLQFPYCSLPNITWLAMVFLFIWLGYLFISLGAAAEEFFCPNLNTIATTLRLSQNVAGVTFLALGNGAPDIFSVISAVRASRGGEAGLAIGEIFGAGIFITTVIVGSISLIKPCDLPKRPFLRDSIIYLLSVFWTFYLLWNNVIDVYNSVGFIVLYVLYVIIVVVGREIRMWHGRNKPVKLFTLFQGYNNNTNVQEVGNEPVSRHNILVPSDDSAPNSVDVGVSRLTPNYGAVEEQGKPLLSIPKVHTPADVGMPGRKSPMRMFPGGGIRRTKSGGIDISQTAGVAFLGHDEQQAERSKFPENSNDLVPILRSNRLSRTVSRYMTNFKLEVIKESLKEFLWAISPINEGYKNLNCFWKVFQIIKYPVWLLLTITIPVVDLEADKQSWKKWLFVLQSFLWPTFSVLATQGRSFWINGVFPLWGISLIIGLILAILVALTSSYHEKPFYHRVFSFVGFTVSVIWIYSLANEVVNVLEAFGVVLSLTKAILGLTFLAWGNSVGDFVADTTLARQGYPRTGLSACYGGPLLNTLIGIGVAWTIKCLTSGQTSFELKFSSLELVSAGFLIFNLCVTLIVLTITQYRLHWIFGIYLLVYYVIFLVVGILLEAGVFEINLPNIDNS